MSNNILSMFPDRIVYHLHRSWCLKVLGGKWYAEVGGFDTAEQAEAWIRSLGSSQTADKVESYPASSDPQNAAVAASYAASQAILNRDEDANALPACVMQPIATLVPDPVYYMPGPYGSFRSMTYDAILADLGPEKTAALFAFKRHDAQPNNPRSESDMSSRPLSRIGGIFRMLGLRT